MLKKVFKALCIFIMVNLLLIQVPTAFAATSVVLSGVPSYNQNNTGYPYYYYTCGPTAGANILSYWDSMGYIRLWTPTSRKDSKTGVSLIKDLAVHMESKSGEGTLPANFSKIIFHTYDCGYSFGSYLYEKETVMVQ